jgi:hypothetical protein
MIVRFVDIGGIVYHPGFSKCAGDQQFRHLLSHFRRLKIIEHGFSNNFYVYVNCHYSVLLIYIFLSITFTTAINRTLTNPPFSKYI